MKRRTMMLGATASFSAAMGGLGGFAVGRWRERERYPHPLDVIKAHPSINFDQLSTDIWLKMLTGRLRDADRPALARELIERNPALFAPYTVGRQSGEPGFYSAGAKPT